MFLVAFGLWQIPYLFSLPEGIRDLVNSAVQIAIIAVFMLSIKLSGSNFGEHGFKWFEDSKKQIAVSIFLAGVYILITLYLQGFIVGFDALPPISLDQVPAQIVKALLTGFTIELVFRGYMQGEFTKAYGFLPALYVSSFLFSIYWLSPLSRPITTTLTTIFTIMGFFVLGIFLGLFFQRTKSLVGPVSFQMAHKFASTIIPIKTSLTTIDYAPHIMLAFEVIANICVILLMNLSVPKRN